MAGPQDRQDTTIYIRAVDATRTAFRSVSTGLEGLNKTALRLGLNLGALSGVLSAGAFAVFTARSINAVAALDDLHETTGLTVEFLSRLEQAATIGGHSLDSVAQSASKFARNVGEARAGNEKLLRAFDAVGISVDDLRSKSIDTLFETYAVRIATADDAAVGLAAAVRLGGKAAAEQIPFYKDLAEQGLAAARVTTEQVAAAEKLQKNFGALKNELAGFGITVATAVIPKLNEMFAAFRDGIEVTGGFWESLRRFGTLNPFQNTSEQLTSLRKQLDEMREGRDLLAKLPGDYSAAIARADDAIQGTLQRIEFVSRRQRREALQGRTGAEFLDVRDLQAAAGAAGGFRIDAAKLGGQSEALAKAFAKAAEQRAKREADAERSLAEERLGMLSRFYGEGLIANADYWKAREDAQRKGLEGELRAIEVEIAARRRAVSETTRGTDERISAEADLAEAIARRNTAEVSFGRFVVQNNLDAARATREYQDSVTELQARLDEVQGREEEALRKRQAAQSRGIRARAGTAGDVETLRTVDALEAAEVAQVRFNKARQDAEAITARLAIEEERIQNSRRSGALSEIEALRRTESARKDAAEQLSAVADRAEEVAKRSGLAPLILQSEQLRAELERLRAESELLADTFQQIGEEAGATFLEDAITQTKNLKDAFRDMVDSIARDITRLAAQDISKRMFGSIGEGGGRGFGDLLANIFKGLGFGGGGAAAGGLNLSAFGPAFANGGAFTIGGSGGTDSQLVRFWGTPGERVTVTKPGRGGGGVNVVNNFNVSGQMDPRTQQQIAAAAGMSITRAMNRGT